jgi:hypothetical protein
LRTRKEEVRRDWNAREEGLSGDVVEEHGFEFARDVGVDAVLSHTLVVLQVVFLQVEAEGKEGQFRVLQELIRRRASSF